jgi:predicted transposase YbfD/YdcC
MRIKKVDPNIIAETELSPSDLASLADLKLLLASFHDPRMAGKVCFPLPEVIIIAFCAMLANANHFTDFALFARYQLPWLRTFLTLPSGAPSHDVFRNVFIALKPEALLEVMAQWTGSLNEQHVIIDGKCLRGTNQGGQGAAAKVFLLRAWVRQAGLSIGQLPCGEKSCELAALPPLLDSLHLSGAVVSIDAMGTHPEIAAEIHEQGADYVLALKKNQPQAYAEIEQHFQEVGQIDPATPTTTLPQPDAAHQRHETVEHSHGRYAQRITTTTGALDWFTRDWKWAGLQSITELRRRTHRNGTREELSEEVHYYLSSLPPDAARLAKVIRDHWAVENSCHHILDVTYGEDHCQVQDTHAAQNLSLLREMTLKTLKDYPLKASVASKRKLAGYAPVFRLKLFLHGIASIFQA